MNKPSPKLKNGKSVKDALTLIKLPVIIATVAIMAAAFLLTGCKPKTSTPATQPTVKSTPAQATPAQAAPAQAAPAQAAPAYSSASERPAELHNPVVVPPNAVLYTPGAPWNPMQINGRIRGWYREHGRMPTSFDEFAATSGLQIPPPPPGMKYEFDPRLHVKVVKAQ